MAAVKCHPVSDSSLRGGSFTAVTARWTLAGHVGTRAYQLQFLAEGKVGEAEGTAEEGGVVWPTQCKEAAPDVISMLFLT